MMAAACCHVGAATKKTVPYTACVASLWRYHRHFVSPTSLVPTAPIDDVDEVWETMRCEAELEVEEEPILSGLYHALAFYLATKLGGHGGRGDDGRDPLSAAVLKKVFAEVLHKDPDIGRSIRADIRAARDRDPTCSRMVHCFLFYKGFLAIQAHRIAHRLWLDGRRGLALLLQSKVSEAFAVDVHPGATIGSGILLDHATGVVIGETAVVGDDVSILHNVTLGGRGEAAGDRHPKIGDGVLVGAGTQILGNVRIEDGAKIGAGSVVLKQVPALTTVVGNPARQVATKKS